MLKKVSWLGDSLDKLKEFPDEIKQNLGYELHRLQTGERPLDSKPMKSINQGVYELRDRDKSSWYRVIYYVKIKDSIYVLHSFEKKSNKTPQKDIALAQSRLKELKKRVRNSIIGNTMKETKKSKSIISHTSKGSVLDDLGLNNEACSSIKVKAEIHSKIIKEIEKNKITSRELEKLLDKPQPRVSELLNGKISNISIEKLLDYLNLLGGEATVKVIFKKRKSA